MGSNQSTSKTPSPKATTPSGSPTKVEASPSLKSEKISPPKMDDEAKTTWRVEEADQEIKTTPPKAEPEHVKITTPKLPEVAMEDPETPKQEATNAALGTPARKERERALKLDIVLSPAIKSKPAKSSSRPTSPVTAEAIEKKLTAAEERKVSLDTLRMKNITDKLAKIELAQQKKEELVTEKALKAKEVVETKLKTAEEYRISQLQTKKEKVNEHMTKIMKAQKELESQMEEARLATEAALKEQMSKAGEIHDQHLHGILEKLKKHEEHISQVRLNQEEKLKPYVVELEININKKLEEVTKRREEVVAKVVEVAKTADKISLAQIKKEEQAVEEAARVASELADKLHKAADLKMKQDAELKEKLAEQSRKAEVVRKNKEKLVAEGGSQTTEAC